MVSARSVRSANQEPRRATIKPGLKFQSARDQEEGREDGGRKAGRRTPLMRAGKIEGFGKKGERDEGVRPER